MWILRFIDYMADGIRESNKPSGELMKRQLLNKSDKHWFNKLESQLENLEYKTWNFFEQHILREMGCSAQL